MRYQHFLTIRKSEMLPSFEFLVQQAKEAEIIERYSRGEISVGKLGELLGLGSWWEAEAFLQGRGVVLNYDENELDRDLATLERLETAH